MSATTTRHTCTPSLAVIAKRKHRRIAELRRARRMLRKAGRRTR